VMSGWSDTEWEKIMAENRKSIENVPVIV